MRPTEVLVHEHTVIVDVLHCLDRIAAQGLAAGRLNEADARGALDFFRNFADRCHHAKEEGSLFPALESKGIPREGGPIGVMLAEHEQGRGHVRKMFGLLPDAAAGQREAVQSFSQEAHAYVELLSAHIDKENHVLFAIADAVLPADEQKKLLDAFDHLEQAEMGEGTHAKFHALAEGLIRKYGAADRTIAKGGSSACGHCGTAR